MVRLFFQGVTKGLRKMVTLNKTEVTYYIALSYPFIQRSAYQILIMGVMESPQEFLRAPSHVASFKPPSHIHDFSPDRDKTC